ncbi:hypothetical protein SCHPADRAFT_944483 [Schizopora paradoxa]|uniref:BTB domain-containing protein n=1 Tax=Schizopora paradoxa TaxID=27342 RepID=A0A0H2R970_9AGAM|nr:hypothetical protein SCHPADRAFT_944483 [Schizopora paradoxa]
MVIDLQEEEIFRPPQPHESLWFPDGNVILATDNHLFKLYRSFLSLHSTVFNDLFRSANNNDINVERIGLKILPELYDGLPMIRFMEDDGEDVAHLLRAAFENNYYNSGNDDMPLRAIVALLRLGSKFGFERIKKDITLHVSRHYPLTLLEYDAVDNDGLPLFGRHRRDCHFPLLAVAYKAEIDILLPSLFFACSEYGVETIFRRTRSMGNDGLRILMKGRDALQRSTSKLVSDLPEQLRDEASNSKCRKKTSCLANACFSNLPDLIQPHFVNVKGSCVVADHLNSVCAACSSLVEEMIDVRREEIWNSIPSHFNLPMWDILQAKQREMVGT